MGRVRSSMPVHRPSGDTLLGGRHWHVVGIATRRQGTGEQSLKYVVSRRDKLLVPWLAFNTFGVCRDTYRWRGHPQCRDLIPGTWLWRSRRQMSGVRLCVRCGSTAPEAQICRWPAHGWENEVGLYPRHQSTRNIQRKKALDVMETLLAAFSAQEARRFVVF